MDMKTFFRSELLTAIIFATAMPIALRAAPQSAAECVNVFAEGGGPLANISGSVGLAPIAITFGDVPGMLSSIVISLGGSGAQNQGAQHLTLMHTFVSIDPARPGTLTTEDRAICAPAGSDPAVCRVNDVLTVVSGTGIFAHASGSLRNHGELNFNTYSLTFSIRGRVCGDGL
jgi:hypothetical protein